MRPTSNLPTRRTPRRKSGETPTGDVLRRMVEAIADGSHADLHYIVRNLIEEERRAGRKKLASDLEALIGRSRPAVPPNVARLPSPRNLAALPTSRRHSESLVTVFQPETLEHHMVLRPEVEERFKLIEREYAARDRLSAHGLMPRRTILLYGPPGCGKSLGAKRLAWTLGLPLMKVKFDALISSYFGESAANLRMLFESAKERPCVLLLDECDFIARSRMNTKDVGEASRIVNSLLQLMEDYDAPGLLVATTNLKDSLDRALFRRFDDVLLVPPPGIAEIERLLRLTLSAVECSPGLPFGALAGDLRGATAATVVKVAHNAAKAAVLSGRATVTEHFIRDAMREAVLDEAGDS
jgi:SpoVK/Ycf46/Vps4 family AAA+-type ATPase